MSVGFVIIGRTKRVSVTSLTARAPQNLYRPAFRDRGNFCYLWFQAASSAHRTDRGLCWVSAPLDRKHVSMLLQASQVQCNTGPTPTWTTLPQRWTVTRAALSGK